MNAIRAMREGVEIKRGLFAIKRCHRTRRYVDDESAKTQVAKAVEYLKSHGVKVTLDGLALLTDTSRGTAKKYLPEGAERSPESGEPVILAMATPEPPTPKPLGRNITGQTPEVLAAARASHAARIADAARLEGERRERRRAALESVREVIRAYRANPNNTTEKAAIVALHDYWVHSSIPPEVDGYRWRENGVGELEKYPAAKVAMGSRRD